LPTFLNFTGFDEEKLSPSLKGINHFDYFTSDPLPQITKREEILYNNDEAYRSVNGNPPFD